MAQLYRLARKALSWAFLAVFAALIGDFAIDVAREHGLFDSPTQRVEAIMNFLQRQPWFWPSVSGLAGLVIGMWIDSVVRQMDTSAGASETHETEMPDYAHGLALVQVQPSLDGKNVTNTLELRIVIRNATGFPLKYEGERYEIVFGEIVLKCSITSAVMPKDGVLTFFPNRGLSRKQYSSLPTRTTGTLEYQIKYGHPERGFSRRAYKLIQIDLFKKKGRANINWIIRNESDDPI